MNDEQLDEIEARAKAATPGPWVPKYLKTLYSNGEVEHQVKSSETGAAVLSVRFRSSGSEIGEDQEDRDVLFAAHARSDVPALVAEVRRLRRQNAERLYKAMTEWPAPMPLSIANLPDVPNHPMRESVTMPLRTLQRFRASFAGLLAFVAQVTGKDPQDVAPLDLMAHLLRGGRSENDG